MVVAGKETACRHLLRVACRIPHFCLSLWPTHRIDAVGAAEFWKRHEMRNFNGYCCVKFRKNWTKIEKFIKEKPKCRGARSLLLVPGLHLSVGPALILRPSATWPLHPGGSHPNSYDSSGLDDVNPVTNPCNRNEITCFKSRSHDMRWFYQSQLSEWNHVVSYGG